MLDKYGTQLLRYGMCFVLFYFSIVQFLNPSDWTGYLPSFLGSSIMWIYINAIFEAIFGILLLIGFFTRPVAALLGIHLVGISYSIGFSSIGVRDIGLALATLSISLMPVDSWTLDFRRNKTKVKHNNEIQTK